MTDSDRMQSLQAALLDVARAAYGDSNDAEFDALNNALDEALSLLGVTRPELTDEEIEAIENA